MHRVLRRPIKVRVWHRFGKYFTLRWVDHDGHYRSAATNFRNRSEALVAARDLEEELNGFRRSRLRKNKGISVYFRQSDKKWCGSVYLGKGMDGKVIRRTVYGINRDVAEQKAMNVARSLVEECEQVRGERGVMAELYILACLGNGVSKRLIKEFFEWYDQQLQFEKTASTARRKLAALRKFLVSGNPECLRSQIGK